VGDKWTLLIVRDLLSGPRRFVELQRVLPGISTEQLRSRLNRMVADGMLTRKRYREVPPRVDYELTTRARELAPVLGELARWGFEWVWGPPRASESIDLGAIFRLIPGLVGPSSVSTGSVELTVSDGREGEPVVYLATLSPGASTISEGDGGKTDAHLSGTTAAWIRALSPLGERAALRTSGDRRLADALLDIIALSSGRELGEHGSASASA
jgi:DNA-binding HxlR family transcriptional regulator